MQKRPTLSPLRWVGIAVLLVLLVCVRFFEQTLFYDPLLVFFKHTRNNAVLPLYDTGRLMLGYFFRYALNTLLSLGILWLAFKDIAIIKVTVVLYTLLFILLALGLYAVLSMDVPPLKGVFYLRRFLMQPLLLLLFLPAFYYQKHIKA